MNYVRLIVLYGGMWSCICASLTSGLVAQEEELGAELPAKGVHPVYGEPEGDPIPTPSISDPSVSRVDLGDGVQLMSELVGANVYSSREELLGNVEDVVVRLPEWTVPYLLVRPAIGVPVETGTWFAVGPDIMDVEEAAVLVNLPAEDLVDAPAVSEEGLMVIVDRGNTLIPVYRVRMAGVAPSVEDRDSIYGQRNLPPELVDPEDLENPERLIDPEDLADREDLVDPEKVDPEKVDPEKMDPEKVDPLRDLAR